MREIRLPAGMESDGFKKTLSTYARKQIRAFGRDYQAALAATQGLRDQLDWTIGDADVEQIVTDEYEKANLAKLREMPDEGVWPAPPVSEAFYGLAGDVVDAFDPYTEADKAAVLVQFLAGAGVAFGPGPRLPWGAGYQYARLNAIPVGGTSSGKGESWAAVKRVLQAADPSLRTVSGLASGEGLIEEVRDATVKPDPKTGTFTVTDPGVEDKRLLLMEPEWARFMRSSERSGNVASAVIRAAWDDGDLSVTAKTTKAVATGAHIGVVGHITREELHQEMSSVDAANGMFNRFLFLAVRPSKSLTFPGRIDQAVVEALGRRLRAAIDFAESVDEMYMSEAAKAVYSPRYEELKDPGKGRIGQVLARSRPYVLRLSMVYALLDGSQVIDGPHMRAALAVWDFCKRSVQWIFSDGTGDVVADKILAALRESGPMTRSEVSKTVFRNHKPADEVEAAFEKLVAARKARRQTERTSGRPKEIWMLF